MQEDLRPDRQKSVSAVKSDAEWRKTLSPEEFRITREHGSERAFSHRYYQEKRRGMYNCACCGAPLFSSDTKYDSGTGWPSFYAPAACNALSEHEDRSLLMRRTEVRCAKCEAHLGQMGPIPPVFAIASTALPSSTTRTRTKAAAPGKSFQMDAKLCAGTPPPP